MIAFPIKTYKNRPLKLPPLASTQKKTLDNYQPTNIIKIYGKRYVMPVVTDLKKEARKSLILHELAKPGGEKDFKGIATKYRWDSQLTKDLVADIQAELEDINTFNRARVAIKASPGAVDRVIDGANTEYTEPELKLKGWREGLRTLQALDPKLRTVQVNVTHQGNVLLTIQNATKGLLARIEANYEVVEDKIEPEPEPSQTNYEANQPTITSPRAENVQPEPASRADLALERDKSREQGKPSP